MAYRYESSAVYENKRVQNLTMQEITQAIWELGQKADEYAQKACISSEKAQAAVMKAKQVFSK
ncbi:hypothetical protein ACLSU7_16390 [Bdellovibrio sp. HCB185ZH]|uniref:hypothetical protein n=1 Tax=Bdellovibrio sp. HCB185ZH TaxID=3394235 RepID=UPI0039A708BD